MVVVRGCGNNILIAVASGVVVEYRTRNREVAGGRLKMREWKMRESRGDLREVRESG